MRSRLFVPVAIGIFLLLLACSGAPPTPSGEQYFTDAKNNLPSSDYNAALKNLDRCVSAAGEKPVGRQCTILRTALLLALADGSKRMAEAYGTGRQEPAGQAQSGRFTKMRADYYGIARVRLLNAMESVMAERGKLSEKPMPLEISFPEFSGKEPAAITMIKGGHWVGDDERYRAELESVRNALARTLAALVGAGEDVHKGHAAFEKGGAQIDPPLYLLEMSSAFLRLSEIFGPRGLDDSRYRRASLEVVRDDMDVALKLLQSKPDKDLEARVKKMKADCEKQLKALGV